MHTLEVKHFLLLTGLFLVQTLFLLFAPLPGVWMIILSICFACFGIFLVLRSAFGPARLLIEGLDVVLKGNYKYQTRLNSEDAFGKLSQAIDALTERLAELSDQTDLAIQCKDESNERLKISYQRQALYSQLFENPNYAVFFCNFSGDIVDANQTASDLLGYDKRTLLNSSFYDLFPKTELAKTIEARKAGVDENAIRYESQFLTAEGNTLDVEISSNVFDFRNELIQNIVGDITLRKSTERLLRESEEKFRTFMESVEDMIFITNRDGYFSYANQSMLAALGYSGAEIENKRLQDIVIEKKVNLDDVPIDHFITFESKYKELDWLTSDGQRIPGELKTVGIYDEKYRLQGLRGIFRDVSERIKVHESQRLAQLGKISADISHEVKNRLTAILSIADFLLMELDKSSELAKDLNIIKEECLYLDEFSRQMLNFSKPSGSEYVLADIHAILEKMAMLMRKSLAKSQIELTTAFGSQIPRVMIDEKQMAEVFLNILQNAQDASPKKGEISISTERDENHVFVHIQDHGEGIPEENLKKIFDPFFSTKQTGTGLGLSASYGIVQAHGGELFYKSRLSEGTRATVKLPIHNQS